MVNGMVSLAFGLFLFLRRGGLWPPVAGSFPLLGGGGYYPPVCPRSAARPVGRFRRGGTTTEPPRDGRTLGAIALVGVQAHSINTERQRAARGIVSCPLPAPDGDTPPLDGSPVKINGGPGRGGIKTRSVFPDAVPRRRFAYFADAGKVGRPQAKPSPTPSIFYPHSCPSSPQ